MAHIFDRKKADNVPRAVQRSAGQGIPGLAIPNSAMLSLLGYRDGGGTDAPDRAEALDALRKQRPAAEQEADRLSAGVAAATPEQLKLEMGRRLGADFSSVRFHSDAASVRQGGRMGARAWTRGGDVYFSEGGFDPAVAAHELVHTVQQGAVAGQVSETAPAGAVQMLPNPFKWIRDKYRNWKAKKAAARQAEKRPWEFSEDDLKANKFNPGGVDEVADVQGRIDQAKTPAEAFRIFSDFAGSDQAEMLRDDVQTNWDPQEVDMDRFRAKMKNMARMVYDYPELKGMIGDLIEINDDRSSMAASSTKGGYRPSQLRYNATVDSMFDPKMVDGTYDRAAATLKTAGHIYDGNHELGHVLNTLLFSSKTKEDRKRANADWDLSVTADHMLQEALSRKGVLTDRQRAGLKRYAKTDLDRNVVKGQIDLSSSDLAAQGITSQYGETDASEFFAEAFADVYAHGANARKASIEIVKVYEERRKRKE